jgi:hypothetical protein
MSDFFDGDGHLTWLGLSARADGELPPSEAGLARSHLGSCGACRAEEESMTLVVRSSSTPPGAGAGLSPPERRAAAVRAALAAFDEASTNGPGHLLPAATTPDGLTRDPVRRRLPRAAPVAAAILLLAAGLTAGIAEIGTGASNPTSGKVAALPPSEHQSGRALVPFAHEIEVQPLVALTSCSAKAPRRSDLVLHYSWANGRGCAVVGRSGVTVTAGQVTGTSAAGGELVVRLRRSLNVPRVGVVVIDGRIVGKVTPSKTPRELRLFDLSASERVSLERSLGR